MKLAELQSEFAAALDAAGATPAWVGGSRPAERFDVYRNNVTANYRSALRAVYVVVAQLVGESYFVRIADLYARADPSVSGDIHGFGARFPEFLGAQGGADSFPYLSDVARLEWLMHESFHASERGPLDPSRLGSVDPGDYGELHFEMHPGTRLLRTAHPAKRIWEIHQPGFEGAFQVDFAAGGETLLIARRAGYAIEIEHLTEGEFALLSSFGADQPLSAAMETALAAEPTFDFASSLAKRVADRTLVDFRS